MNNNEIEKCCHQGGTVYVRARVVYRHVSQFKRQKKTRLSWSIYVIASMTIYTKYCCSIQSSNNLANDHILLNAQGLLQIFHF